MVKDSIWNVWKVYNTKTFIICTMMHFLSDVCFVDSGGIGIYEILFHGIQIDKINFHWDPLGYVWWISFIKLDGRNSFLFSYFLKKNTKIPLPFCSWLCLEWKWDGDQDFEFWNEYEARVYVSIWVAKHKQQIYVHGSFEWFWWLGILILYIHGLLDFNLF